MQYLKYMRSVLCTEVDLETLARGTSGFTGADLANLINQAALHGSAIGGNYVTNEDLEYAKWVLEHVRSVCVKGDYW